MKSVYVQDLDNNFPIDDVFSLDSGELLPFNRKPGNYLRLTISDKTGTITATLWDNAEDAYNQIADSKFVKIAGKTSTYKGKLTINVNSVEPVETEEVDLDDFLPTTSKDIAEMITFLESVIDGIGDPNLKELLDMFLDDDEFMTILLKPQLLKISPALSRADFVNIQPISCV